MEFREIYVAELKAVGFSAADAEEIAAWYLGDPLGAPFPAHCRRVALGAGGYDPSEPRNADGEWTSGGGARPASDGEVNSFLSSPPDNIDHEKAKALLARGFTDRDGAGNQVKYGNLLLEHICDPKRHENDQRARLRMLGTAVKLVRTQKPTMTGRAGGRERVYSGIANGKAYVAVADEHNEINAMVMVSYRRDRDSDREVKA